MQENLLLKRLNNEHTDKMPIWFMRQAGRYLPEYQKIRCNFNDFINFCLSPKEAANVTLQPINRFDLDAAILFADILLVPYAMGQKIKFKKNLGPILEPIDDLNKLSVTTKSIEAVYETVKLVKKKLPTNKALIGFSGGIWTTACYMIHGRGKEGFGKAIKKINLDPIFLANLFEKLELITSDYLLKQAEAGVDVLKIFDSHAGLLTGEEFNQWVIQPTRRIVSTIKKQFPELPIIGFPRGATLADYQKYEKQTGIDAIALDQHMNRIEMMHACPKRVLQGNLDPEVLVSGGEIMERAVWALKKDFAEKHIFNLGHGILPHTPPDHVSRLVELIRE